MTPQEYSLQTNLAAGAPTWRHYKQSLLNNPSVVNSINFGAFFDTTTQGSGGLTTANLVGINSTDYANGISVVNGSQITFSNAGNYYIDFQGQFLFSGGTTNYDITNWYAVNGVNAPNSSYTFTIGSAQRSQTLTNVTDINYFHAGDYIQFYWWSNISPSAIALTPTAAGTLPTRPFAPSVNVNIIQLA